MDIGKSFGFIFEDERWGSKVLIGGLLGLIPILNLAALGYALQTHRNVVRGELRPLPNWDNLGAYLASGLVAGVAYAMYALPLGLAVALSSLVSAFVGRGGDSQVLGSVVWAFGSMLTCLTGLYALFLAVWLPAATVRFAHAGALAAFFEFREIWEFIARNMGGYVVALLVAWVGGLAALVVGAVFLVLGVAFTGLMAALVWAHLMGQVVCEAPAAAGL